MDGIDQSNGRALFCILAAFPVLVAAMILVALAGIDELTDTWALFYGSVVSFSSEANNRESHLLLDGCTSE